jgi:hypothetical protein
MNRRTMLMLLAGGAGGSFLTGNATRAFSPQARAADAAKTVTLYKDPECSCCEGYADYLRSSGFAVKLVPTHDLPLLDEKYGIATDLSPCHISLVAGYVVGGHVPVAVVNRLLAEKPRITGITLPGMVGTKTAPFIIYEITTGPRKVYAVV